MIHLMNEIEVIHERQNKVVVLEIIISLEYHNKVLVQEGIMEGKVKVITNHLKGSEMKVIKINYKESIKRITNMQIVKPQHI